MTATARDIMTRSVLVLPRDGSLEEAALALSAHGVSGAPVCDPHGKLVGVVSKGDLAEGCLGPRAHACTSIGDVMSVDVAKTGPDASLDSVAQTLVFEGIHRIVVVDSDDSIIGIISPLDVLRAIVESGPMTVGATPRSSARFPSWPAEK